MGKPGQRTLGKPQYEPSIQHFSHDHQLQLLNTKTQPSLNFVSCAGCKLQPSEWVYACEPCNFILHIPCSNMPKLIHHPVDPNHTFTLLAKPAYPTGLFGCDACGDDGDGFSYNCGTCGIDIHILCATKPLSLTHQAHRCPLNLTFSPTNPSKTFTCNICQREGFNHWVYRCNLCEFDAHLHCATQNPPSSPSSPPVSSQNQTRSLVHPQAQSSLHQQAQPQPQSTLYQQPQPQPQPQSTLYQQPQPQSPPYQQAQPQPHSSLYHQPQPHHPLYQQAQPHRPLYQQPQAHSPLYQQAQPQPHNPLYQQPQPHSPFRYQQYVQPAGISAVEQTRQNYIYMAPQQADQAQRNDGGIITSQVQSLIAGNSVTGAMTRQFLRSL